MSSIFFNIFPRQYPFQYNLHILYNRVKQTSPVKTVQSNSVLLIPKDHFDMIPLDAEECLGFSQETFGVVHSLKPHPGELDCNCQSWYLFRLTNSSIYVWTSSIVRSFKGLFGSAFSKVFAHLKYHSWALRGNLLFNQNRLVLPPEACIHAHNSHLIKKRNIIDINNHNEI